MLRKQYIKTLNYNSKIAEFQNVKLSKLWCLNTIKTPNGRASNC